MNGCVMCGMEIPEGQRTCSMCYGDPEHGSDGYYKRWIAEQQEAEAQQQEAERQHREEEQEEEHP